jgi:hypothetical protein
MQMLHLTSSAISAGSFFEGGSVELTLVSTLLLLLATCESIEPSATTSSPLVPESTAAFPIVAEATAAAFCVQSDPRVSWSSMKASWELPPRDAAATFPGVTVIVSPTTKDLHEPRPTLRPLTQVPLREVSSKSMEIKATLPVRWVVALRLELLPLRQGACCSTADRTRKTK